VGLLAEITGGLPGGWADGTAERIAAIAAADAPAERRAWRLWLEAQWARRAGAVTLAHEALDSANEAARATDVTPTWLLEAIGLRAKLLHEAGDLARAYEPLKQTMEGWLLLGDAFEHPRGEAAEFVRETLKGAKAMVTAVVPSEHLQTLAREAGATPDDTAAGLWITDRAPTEAAEIIARAVRVEADVASFAEACRAADRALAATRTWSLPSWQPSRFEIKLRTTLSGAVDREQQFAAGIDQADAGLALVAQIPDGAERTRADAELRSNRARALLYIGRCGEAAAEFDRARQAFEEVGDSIEAVRTASGALSARAGAGEPIDASAVRQLLEDLEAAEQTETFRGAELAADLEYARRWLLTLLAEEGTQDLEEVVAIIEVLRDDRPLLRAGIDRSDPVVVCLCRPFKLLGARLRRLPDTTLVIFEPGLAGGRERPAVFLVVSSGDGRWRLVDAGSAGDALSDLRRCANEERERLLTGEIPMHAAPSDALRDAAVAAWRALPPPVREAVGASRTVLYMPSGGAELDTIPFELLLHEDGWLGATHAVARCPSFQWLETMLAPNARRRREGARALVAYAPQDEQLGVLDDLQAEVELGLRAAAVLGLEAERCELADPAAVLDAFTDRALVHYVGHGVASAIGEALLLSADTSVSASQLTGRGPSAPFVFFNACLLGRVRHLPGGSQQGWALRLLTRGAPGVIGTLATVPDRACVPVAEAFYGAAWKEPLGEAMRQARARLNEAGIHPVVWAAYVLHGDPNAGISTRARGSSADLVSDWPTLALRLLATRAPEHREALLAAPGVPATVAAWAAGRAVLEKDLIAATDQLLDDNPEGAAVCRILLAFARLERDRDDTDELDVAYLASAALQDGYAVLHVLITHRDTWEQRDPGGAAALRATADSWLAALEGDHGSLAPIEARLRENA